jgi:hypothetical protein
MTFKTVEDAMEARTVASARLAFHLQRATNLALDELVWGSRFDNEMLQVATWRQVWEVANAGFIRLNNAYQDELEVRNGG